ncbi:MAG TPA: SIMPL domain-containing protein [Candidatus Cloacimonadota bacterium]|nr:SIMPL domain-containing protein [Candidatus Cloacimonadota bacterium]HPT71907.1 SIMPL domain-containing protein [Candidatus Cloacimonadota bacterium]
MKTWTALILGLCFIIGLGSLGSYFYKARHSESTIRVVGMATKSFDSDLVKWNMTISRSVPTDQIKLGYKQIADDMTALKAYAVSGGIPEKDISIQPVNSQPMYDNYGNQKSFSLSQNVFIISKDIPLIEKLALTPTFFAEKGIVLQSSNLDYFNTKLADIKKQLLGEATKDALARAKEIASAAHAKVGKISNAKAGIFQITEPYSTDVSDYGIYRTNTKKKDIKVTLSAEFTLK